jgi:hypothetical protein
LFFFREICEDVVTVEKEIARKEAEEILKKKEEERQKLIDMNAAEVCAVRNADVFKNHTSLFISMHLHLTFSILQSTFHKHLNGIT